MLGFVLSRVVFCPQRCSAAAHACLFTGAGMLPGFAALHVVTSHESCLSTRLFRLCAYDVSRARVFFSC